MTLAYTLCFIRHPERDMVLMLYRYRQPNVNRYNGVGGKIEAGESPYAGVLREVEEETGIRLNSARFAGIVTWEEQSSCCGGMYVYVADLPASTDLWDGERETPEGLLVWRSTDSACYGSEVAENIPFFLPPMLNNECPSQFHCSYVRGRRRDVECRPLPLALWGLVTA